MSYQRKILLLLIVGVVVYVAFLGLREVWYPDEPDIAEVARAMYLSGDWISPRRMGEIWVDYPPMIYWIGVISSHLFGGMKAFALRLPNALVALGTILMTAGMARKWFGDRAGFWAGLALLTCLEFVYEGNSYRPDVTFTLFIAAGLFSYAAGAAAGRPLYLRILAFALFGLAMLSKGPLGLLLPGLVLVVWLGIGRDWRRILELAPLSLIAVLVYGAWFLANGRAMGMENMASEFYAQNFERFLTSENRGHGQPWFYYLRNFWLDFSPWSWLFPAAAWWLYRDGRFRNRFIQLAMLWFVIFIAFLSLAATKRQLYLLPAYPAVALMVGVWLAEVSGTARDSRAGVGSVAIRVYAIGSFVVLFSLGALLIWAGPNLQSLASGRDLNELQREVLRNVLMPVVVLGVVLVAAAITIVAAWWRSGNRAALFGTAAAHTAIYIVVLALVMPAFEPVKTYEPQSRWISEQIGDETRFGMVDVAGVPRRGGFAYYTGTDVDLLAGPAEALEYLRRYPNTIVLVRRTQFDNDFSAAARTAYFRQFGEVRVGSHLYTAIELAAPDAQSGAASRTRSSPVTWHLDNLDEIGGYPVTVEGDPVVVDTPFGKAIEFDGVDDGIFLDVHPLAGMATFTVEVIFSPYVDGAAEQRFFHMQENQSDDRVMFETRLVDNERWFLDTFVKSGDQRVTLYAADSEHEIGTWYHAAIVVDESTITHFVNGQAELSDSVRYEQQRAGRTSLGVRLNRVHWFRGAIRTVRFTPRSLSPDEFLTADQ